MFEQTKIAKPYVRTSVNLSPEFYELCKKHNIKISDAVRTGIAILLSEKGVMEYDNRLNIVRKLQFFQKQAEESLQKLSKLDKSKQAQKSS